MTQGQMVDGHFVDAIWSIWTAGCWTYGRYPYGRCPYGRYGQMVDMPIDVSIDRHICRTFLLVPLIYNEFSVDK